MRITYDQKYNIAYISFKEKKQDIETIKISEEIVIDIAQDGTVYGIELLNANKQINDIAGDSLHFIKQSGSETKEFAIAI